MIELVSYLSIAILTFLIALFMMKHGIGVSSDSVQYMSAAENLARGDGLLVYDGSGGFKMLSTWPPLLPFVLSLFELLNIGIEAGARWLNASLFAVNVVLLGLLARRASGSKLSGILVAILAASASAMLQVHASLWAEALFITLFLLGLVCLQKYLAGGTQWYLPGTGLMFGVAVLCRFAGVAFLPAAVIAIIFGAKRGWGQRLYAAGMVGIISILPMACWVAYSASQGASGGKSLAFYGITSAKLIAMVRVASMWALPAFCPRIIKIVFVPLCVMAGAIWLVRICWKGKLKNIHKIAGLMKHPLFLFFIFFLAYEGMLLAVLLTYDPNISIVLRMHLPGQLMAIVLCVVLSLGAYSRLGKTGRPVVAIGLTLLTISYISGASITASDAAKNGLYFRHADFRESKAFDIIETIDKDIMVYTNQYRAIPYYTNRTNIYALPDRIRTDGVVFEGSLENHKRLMLERLEERKAVLVIFENEVYKIKPSVTSLLSNLPDLELWQDTGDTRFYRWPQEDPIPS